MFTFKYIINLKKYKGKFRVLKVILQNNLKYSDEEYMMNNNQIFKLLQYINKNDYYILE